MIFSTVHRRKGMEYDAIQLVNDFITEEKLIKDKKSVWKNTSKLNEEINLLYVAVTRTRNSIHIPELEKIFELTTYSYNECYERRRDKLRCDGNT